MELDEMIRDQLMAVRIPFDPAQEAEAIRRRVRRRRQVRRLAFAVPVGAVAAVGITVVAIGLAPSDDTLRVATETTTIGVPSTTSAPDPLAAAGVCRSLLPETVDPFDPRAPTTAGTAPSVSAPTVPAPPEQEADTPCSRAVAEDLQERLPAGWEPWDDNPFGDPAIGETAPPDSYGTAAVSLIDAEGALLQVTVGFGGAIDAERIQGFGRPLEGLPEGWVGTTDFVPGEDRRSADVTVVRPERLPVMVAVKLSQPSMGAPQPAGTVLPLSFEEVRNLAIAIANDGPVQSP
jgi:hypothetical protein